MENLTPLGSQENVESSTAIEANGGEPVSSPVLPLSESQPGSRPRKPPTITPRSFTRFFTPKSSLERGGRIGASRQALRDITATATNRRGRRHPTKDSAQISDQENIGSEVSGRYKRKIPDSVDVTPDSSSPLKRIRNESLEISEDGSDAENAVSEGEEEEVYKRDRRPRRIMLKITDPITSSGYRGGRGRVFRREIGDYGRITKARPSNPRLAALRDWQYETSNFFSKPEDVHVCNNVAVPIDHTIPFCTESCNSKS